MNAGGCRKERSAAGPRPIVRATSPKTPSPRATSTVSSRLATTTRHTTVGPACGWSSRRASRCLMRCSHGGRSGPAMKSSCAHPPPSTCPASSSRLQLMRCPRSRSRSKRRMRSCAWMWSRTLSTCLLSGQEVGKHPFAIATWSQRRATPTTMCGSSSATRRIPAATPRSRGPRRSSSSISNAPPRPLDS